MAQIIDTRIQHKLDTTANWNNVKDSFTPLKGELIIYQDGTKTLYKIGDGTTTVGTLKFVDIADDIINAHLAGTTAGFVKSGGHATVQNGLIYVNNDSHYHDARYYTETEMDEKLADKADKSHPHNYAGSDNAGGPANSTKGTLTIKNGSNTYTFNGSESKTVNIEAGGTSDGNDNQKVKVGSTTFGDNDTVEFVGGSNVTITANQDSKKITISATGGGGTSDGNQKVQAGSTTFDSNVTVNFKGGTGVTVEGSRNDSSITIAVSEDTVKTIVDSYFNENFFSASY